MSDAPGGRETPPNEQVSDESGAQRPDETGARSPEPGAREGSGQDSSQRPVVSGEGEPPLDERASQETRASVAQEVPLDSRAPGSGIRELVEDESARVAAIKAAIERNDREVADQLRRMSRRGFLTLGIGTVAAIGAWNWLGRTERENGLERPVPRKPPFHYKAAPAYFSTSPL